MIRTLLAGFLIAGLAWTPAPAAAGPYDLDTGREIGLLAGAGLLLGGAALLRSDAPYSPDDLSGLDPSQVNPVDRFATGNWSVASARGSDVLAGGLSLAPLGLLFTDEGGDEPWTLGLMYAETYLLTGAAYGILKGLTARTRPFTYNDDPSIPTELKLSRHARRSFPSGHTATGFMAAVFLARVHDRLHPGSDAGPWLWGSGLAAATATGVLRITAGKHYLTDVLAGAVLGAAIGWVVPELHEVDPEDTPGSGAALSVRIAF